jgi:hypothetical protein
MLVPVDAKVVDKNGMCMLCSKVVERSLAIPSHGTVRGPPFLHLQMRDPPPNPPHHMREPASVTLKLKAVFSSETSKY